MHFDSLWSSVLANFKTAAERSFSASLTENKHVRDARGTPAESVVRKSLLVECSREHAFQIFTEHMGQWWPVTHHVGGHALSRCHRGTSTG